jgi:hypothetical protein
MTLRSRLTTALLAVVLGAFSACTDKPLDPTNPASPPPATGTPPGPPPPPSTADFSGSAASTITVLLEWKPVPGAERFILRRGQTQLIEAWSTQTKFRDSDLAPNTKYAYTLQAVDSADKVLGSFSASVQTKAGSPDRTSADLPQDPALYSRAFEKFNWKPYTVGNVADSAPLWLHNTYWAYGPDNRVYPTWHPPFYKDSQGKVYTFGHEHGRNPAESKLYGVTGPLPFGYVNEQLEPNNAGNQRNEDHVGHKVEFKNDVQVGVPGDDISNFVSGSGPKCSIMAKLHQGTHSVDAFTNNLHEIFYYMECENGVELRWQSFHAFGPAGVVGRLCNNDATSASFVPPTSPTTPNGSSRGIPDRRCLDVLRAKVQQGGDASAEYYTNYREDWPTGFVHGLHRDGTGKYWDNWGQQGAERNPPLQYEVSAGTYFLVSKPSRFFDDTKPGNLGRRLDMCFDASLQIDHPDCQIVRQKNATWDSPDSTFKGTARTVHFDWVRLENRLNQNVLYSNAMGTVSRPALEVSQGVTLRQWVKGLASKELAMYYFGQRGEDFDDVGVHAPN